MDAITAFLNSRVDREIFVEQLKGYENPEFPMKDFVYLLNKALYGLKQSPLLWFKAVGVAMLKMGFRQLENCPCLFIKHTDGLELPGRLEDITDWDKIIIVMVYVDDFLVCTKNPDLMRDTKAQLSAHFKMTDNGPVTNHLGLMIQFYGEDAVGPARVEITNPNYIVALLDKMKMSTASAMPTPISPGYYPKDSPDDERFEAPVLYQEAVGALM